MEKIIIYRIKYVKGRRIRPCLNSGAMAPTSPFEHLQAMKLIRNIFGLPLRPSYRSAGQARTPTSKFLPGFLIRKTAHLFTRRNFSGVGVYFFTTFLASPAHFHSPD